MIKVIKKKYPLLLVMAAGILAFVAVLVFTGGAVRASERDDRIESSFKKSYMYNTYLKAEDIQITCKDGAVTFSGAVADESRWPRASPEHCQALRAWIIGSPSKANNPPRVRICGSA